MAPFLFLFLSSSLLFSSRGALLLAGKKEGRKDGRTDGRKEARKKGRKKERKEGTKEERKREKTKECKQARKERKKGKQGRKKETATERKCVDRLICLCTDRRALSHLPSRQRTHVELRHTRSCESLISFEVALSCLKPKQQTDQYELYPLPSFPFPSLQGAPRISSVHSILFDPQSEGSNFSGYEGATATNSRQTLSRSKGRKKQNKTRSSPLLPFPRFVC